jgi:PA14 domain
MVRMTQTADTTSETASSIERVRSLADRVAGRSYFRVVGSAIGIGVVGVLGVVLVVMLVDYFVGLNYLSRAALVLGTVAGAAWVIRQGLRQAEGESTLTGAALAIESKVEQSGGRIISAIQLDDTEQATGLAHHSPGMVARLIDEAGKVIEGVRASDVVNTAVAKRWLGGAAALLTTLFAVVVLGGLDARLVFLRAMLVPGIERPTATRVEVLTPSPLRVARGEDATIELRVNGKIPEQGELVFIDEQGDSSTLNIKPAQSGTQSGTWTATLNRVMRPGRYLIELGDAAVKPGIIDVVDRPAVRELKFFRTLPAYTALPRQRIEGAAVELLPGSLFDVDVFSSRPLAQSGQTAVRGSIDFIDEQGQVILQEELVTASADASLLRLRKQQVSPPTQAVSMRVRLKDEEELASRSEPQYPIRWLKDQPPVVRRLRPVAASRLVTPWAKIRQDLDASDDWGLAKVELQFSVEREKRITIGPGNGLRATYFPTPTLTGEPVQRVEPLQGGFEITWRDGSPGPTIPADNFSARFEGFIAIPESGWYQFRAEADDAARLFIDDQKIIDMPADNQNQSRQIEISAGVYPIRLEYFERAGWTNLRLALRREREFVVVPGTSLFQDQQAVDAAKPVEVQSLFKADSPKLMQKKFEVSRLLDLAALTVLPGDRVTAWVVATDGSGQESRSDPLLLLVSEEAKVRQSLLEELGDYLEKVDTLQQRQSDLADEVQTPEKAQ